MLPWLFPYGLGGIGNPHIQGRISDLAHKKHLLMYYDKRFQKDPHFPFIAFNHEQIKQATTGSYLLAEKAKFENISQRIMDMDTATLKDIAEKMQSGKHVKPETEEEKLCFQLLKDLDHVGGHIQGSLTNKEYMRNEIWSLISFFGAPSWFITLSPADHKHPISLYYADTKETFEPKLKMSYDEKLRLVANNPVAAACFFHFMVEMFIKHILGIGNSHSGIYGDTAAYYGTVEQQGRLTLHLHMLLFIKGALHPQEIRDRILNSTSDFQLNMVKYLESVHMGKFMTGSMTDIENMVKNNELNNNYQDPNGTLLESPPPSCDENHDELQLNMCEKCNALQSWWGRFKSTVDDILFRSNTHSCTKFTNTDKRSCMKNGKCKARFPREIYSETQVDPATGALHIKKGKPWINTFTPIVTFLYRCNTDVTSLLSGTAIKAIVAYVSDYISKPGLKTYSIFDTIRSVYDRQSNVLNSTASHKEKARKIMTSIINSLTAKLEIGSPFASLYLLGNPDHYKSHQLVVVYWKNFVREVSSFWSSKCENQTFHMQPEKVVLQHRKGNVIGVSPVQDYIFRAEKYANVPLYEWLQYATRVKINKPHQTDETETDDLDIINLKIADDAMDIIQENTKPYTLHSNDNQEANILNLQTSIDQTIIEDKQNTKPNSTAKFDRLLCWICAVPCLLLTYNYGHLPTIMVTVVYY